MGKTRAQGFDRFVIRSTLLFGIFVPILPLISEYIFDEKTNTKSIGWSFISYSIVGLLFGWWTYECNEYKYLKNNGEDD